jgi:transcriptional regulator with XRE-family HTH domain
MPEKPILAKNLIEARKLSGWSQVEAADRIGVTRGALAAWEEGRSQPSLQQFKKICYFYGIKDPMHFIDCPDFCYVEKTVRLLVPKLPSPYSPTNQNSSLKTHPAQRSEEEGRNERTGIAKIYSYSFACLLKW